MDSPSLSNKFKKYPTHQLEMFLQQLNDLGETIEVNRPLSMKKEGRSIILSIRDLTMEKSMQ